MEQKQVEDFAMIPAKEAKDMLYTLLSENLVQLQVIHTHTHTHTHTDTHTHTQTEQQALCSYPAHLLIYCSSGNPKDP